MKPSFFVYFFFFFGQQAKNNDIVFVSVHLIEILKRLFLFSLGSSTSAKDTVTLASRHFQCLHHKEHKSNARAQIESNGVTSWLSFFYTFYIKTVVVEQCCLFKVSASGVLDVCVVSHNDWFFSCNSAFFQKKKPCTDLRQEVAPQSNVIRSQAVDVVTIYKHIDINFKWFTNSLI